MKLPVPTLLFCTLISLAACESADTPERQPSKPAAKGDPPAIEAIEELSEGERQLAHLRQELQAGKPAAAAEDDPPAIKAIKALPEGERQQAYLQALQDPSAKIRAAAAREIKPEGAALDRLTDMIVNDPSPEVRIATTWSLETTEDADLPQALDALVKCLEDEDLDVVVDCIKSLAFLDEEPTIVHLQPLVAHEDEQVREAALDALKWMQ